MFTLETKAPEALNSQAPSPTLTWQTPESWKRQLRKVKHGVIAIISMFGIGQVAMGMADRSAWLVLIASFFWIFLLVLLDVIFHRALGGVLMLDEAGFRDVLGKRYEWRRIKKVQIAPPGNVGSQVLKIALAPLGFEIELPFDSKVMNESDLRAAILRLAPSSCDTSAIR